MIDAIMRQVYRYFRSYTLESPIALLYGIVSFRTRLAIRRSTTVPHLAPCSTFQGLPLLSRIQANVLTVHLETILGIGSVRGERLGKRGDVVHSIE